MKSLILPSIKCQAAAIILYGPCFLTLVIYDDFNPLTTAPNMPLLNPPLETDALPRLMPAGSKL